MFRRRNELPGSFSDIERLSESALEVSAADRLAVYEDRWSKGGFHFWAGTFSDIGMSEEANRTAYEFWRDKVRARVHDPVTAELLAPTEPPYPFGTKRPSLEQGYYDVFNKSNVDLVDLRATPIQRVTPSGITTADGSEYPVDIIVLATGFDANTGGLTQIDLVSADGTTLEQRWADGVDTHLGLAVHGFPNLLFLYGPQSPASFYNGPTSAEVQGEWVVRCLIAVRERGVTRIESTAEAERVWSAHIADVAASLLMSRTESWYMGANIPGKRRQLLNYPGTDAYLSFLDACETSDYSGFILT